MAARTRKQATAEGLSRSERMASWLEERWSWLETVKDDPLYGLYEDEWIERLRRYEDQCTSERGSGRA